jgi:hypothetical protein
MRLLPLLIIILLLVGVVLAVRIYMQRAAAQRAAHDARLAAMAQVYLRAAKKKQEAQASAPQTATTPLREERECPFCAEKILKKARVCKHCGRDVEPLA